MSRHDETIGRMPNPSQYYLEWNSEEKTFCYYSKETEQRVPFKLPFQFIALKFMNTVTGYDDQRKQGIYANEVADTRYEELRVAYRDNSPIAKGLYSQIKDYVKGAGGQFPRSIYAMTGKGIIVNIKLRGGQMINFSEIEKHGNRWKDEWIQVNEFETKKYESSGGEIKEYTVPIFRFGGTLNGTAEATVEKQYQVVKQYFLSRQQAPASQTYAAAPAQPSAYMPQTAGGDFQQRDDDDLPF
jgi:hypothetical protein